MTMSLERVEAFSHSKPFLEIVNVAQERGITIKMKGLSTIVFNNTTHMETEWIWDTSDAEEVILTVLKARLDILSNNTF